MAQQRISFEWVMEEDPLAPWHSQTEGEMGEVLARSMRESVWTTRLTRALSLVLLAIFTTAGAALSPNEQARLIAQEGVEFTLDQENLAWRTRDRSMYETLIDPYVSEDWREEWRDHWRSGAEAAAEYEVDLLHVEALDSASDATVEAAVLIHQPAMEWWQSSPYREARFYRRAGQNWVRSAPPKDYWGERQSLATDHLIFKFYAKDAAAVAQAAETLERAYAEMYPLLGLQTPSPDDKLTIHVQTEPVGRWSAASNELAVTSPRMSQIPEGQSEAEYLAYDIMGWFTYRALRDATPGTAGRYLYRWPILVWGLRGWLRDDLLDQPSPWRAEAMQVLEQAAPTHLPFGLNNITDLAGQGRPTREQIILRYLAAESFVDFVVATHGRERLPELLNALIRHGSWESITPKLYGYSAEKLVADWNIYVLEEYQTKPVPE